MLDLGEENGRFFIAMEFVAGRSLNRIFEAALALKRTLPAEFACHVMAETLRALDYAHARRDSSGRPLGIIHRDVSPHNVMVAYDGAVKLADFGIAKVSNMAVDHTTGPIKGKPGYMSPEQVKQGAIDQRVDLYAAGVVLHELLAMKRMRVSENPLATLMEVAKGDFPRFPDVGVDVPEPVAQVVYKALCANPEGRWQDAGAFAVALDAAARAQGWRWTGREISSLMVELFPEDIAEEEARQTHFSGVVKALSSASTQDVTGIIARAGGVKKDQTLAAIKPIHAVTSGATLPALTPVTPLVTPSKRPRAWKAAALVLLPLSFGAAVVALQPTPPEPAPVVAPATLVVESTPPGARVLMAGKEVPGLTPLVIPNPPPGAVTLDISQDGYVPARSVAVVEAGETSRVSVTLTLVSRELPVTSEPVGALITLNGLEKGRTPATLLLEGNTPADVTLSLPGYTTAQQRVSPAQLPDVLHLTLVKTEVAAVVVRKSAPIPVPAVIAVVEPTPPPPEPPVVKTVVPQVGRLTLQSTPWARIVIDGKDTGKFTPAADLEVTAGEHFVELINDEDKLRTSFPVTVGPGATVRIARSLR